MFPSQTDPGRVHGPLPDTRAVQLAATPGALRAGSPIPRPENLALLGRLDARFAEFLDYARTVRCHSRTSLAWYDEAFRCFRRFLLEGVGLPAEQFELRVLAIEDWQRWNARRGLALVTVNGYFRALRAFFNDWATRDGAANPFLGLKAPPVPSRLPKAKTAPECRRILDAARGYPWPSSFHRARAVAVLSVMLYAGLRRGEVLRLQLDDVRLAEGTILIRGGKGRHGGRDRVAYVAPELESALRQYLRERSARRLVQPEFFASLATGRGIGERSIRRIVEGVRRASGIAFSPHILRHSFITHALRSGVPIQVVRDLAGHRDIATTMGYTRVFDADLRDGARRIRFT